MSNFIRVLVDTDPGRPIHFKIGFELDEWKDNFKSVIVEFEKKKEDCINMSLSELESLGYDDAKRLLQSVLTAHGK